MARSTLTFVGPLVSSCARPQREGPWHFRLVQGGGDPIKLEYPDKDAARGARRILMGNPDTQSILSTKLFEAILTGLREAFKAGHAAAVAEAES